MAQQPKFKTDWPAFGAACKAARVDLYILAPGHKKKPSPKTGSLVFRKPDHDHAIAQLAEDTHLMTSTIESIERGATTVKREHREALSDWLGVDIHDFTTEKQRPNLNA